MDKFSSYKDRVETALKKYESTRALRDTASGGLYETIMREADPFTKGHFTMAVIGKTSSGKSTFVNALLGNCSLLPTAYEQNTCTLTEIEYGDSVQIQVVYGSGRSNTFTDTHELLETAAIPEKYQHLPINFINKLILANKSEDEIIKGKEKLDELQGENVDVSLLREYIKSHSKEKDNIPTRVLIKYPLPDSYRGWKIIDTPGVATLGGIEKETRDFLNGKNKFGYNNVDAIVFVHSSKYPIDDKVFYDFVNQTFLHLNPEARKRVFFVITHAADPNFLDRKDTYINFAKKIFVEGFKIPENRLMCVDSICSLFRQYAKNCPKPILGLKKTDVPQDWDEKTWAAAMNVKGTLIQELIDHDRDLVNENVLLLLKKYSAGIENLRVKLDAFIETEKSASYCRLMKYINDDMSSMLNDFRQKKNMLESSIGNQSLDVLKSKMIAEQEKLEDSKKTFNDILTKVRSDFSKESLSNQFGRYTTAMRQLRGRTSIKEIQLEAENILSEVENTKSTILNEVANTLENLWDKNCSESGINLKIDFRTIASEAEQNHTHTTGGKKIGYEKKPVKQQTFGGSIKRFFGSIFGNKSWGYDEVEDYSKPIYSKVEKHTDYVKAAHEFANKIYVDFSKKISDFVNRLYSHILTIGDGAKIEAENQIKIQQDSYTELVKNNQTLESKKNTISLLESKIRTLQTTISEITELSHDK